VTNPSPWEKTDVGAIVGHYYKVEQLIGEGGQAQVYRAIDMRGGPDVAIKILRDTHAGEADFRERFSREAQILHDLKSPATLRVHGEHFLEDGRPALVTEFLQGRSLGEQLALLEKQGQHIPPAGLLAIVGPVAVALEEAHRVGVIHRDLKPDNLFLLDQEAEGTRVKLLDFGFAKFLNKAALTAEGAIAGSPRYIAPEAWLGVRDLTPAFDVYSLGAVVYHCLVGEPPFPEAGLAALLTKVTTAPRPRITERRPDLPATMDAWVEKSLAITTTDRFPSVTEQFQALSAALS
jgi:serine/threonine-protein kinase